MSYRRVLLVVELGRGATAAAATIRRLAPDAERLVAVAAALRPDGPAAGAREIGFRWWGASASQQAAVSAALEALRSALSPLAPKVETILAEELDAGSLAARASDSAIDLLAGALPPARLPLLAELRKRLSLPLLWMGTAPAPSGPIRDIACLALSERARRAVAVFLRDHGSADLRCTYVGPRIAEPELTVARGVAGVTARVEHASFGLPRSVDLLVLPRFAGALLSAPWRAPVLVLPPLPAWRPLARPIDAADAVDMGETLRVRVTYAAGVGRLEPIPDQELAFVAAGRLVARAWSEGGFVEVRTGGADGLGLLRAAARPGSSGTTTWGFEYETPGPAVPGDRPLAPGDASELTRDGSGLGSSGAAEPVLAIERLVAVIRAGTRPLVLFDASLPDEDLARLHRLGGREGIDLLAVRLRPLRSCASIRARLAASGLPARVADASAVLDEGAALDVPEEVDPVRLARVAARMRGAARFPVAAIVHRGAHTPETIGFPAFRPDEAPAGLTFRFEPPAPTSTLDARLDATTGAPLLAGNRIELELDNPRARAWLLDAIATARHRIHFQVYMALDDDVGTLVEAALAEAGARGVTVRVLVDSLHGLQGSFGLENPLLARLAERTNVELRVVRPIEGPPSVEDLKQRDHRKVVVVDGALALVGGRNLSHEYYAGFDEVALRPDSLWREVPWLDAGARVAGPAVAALERSFLDAWTEAGGAPFDVPPQAPAGPVAARVVVHHGLRDAATLEAYLALVDSARSRVTFVNGFPLVLELQRALLRAIARGVRVRALVGHTTPTHGDTPFRGPWSTARQAATALVDSRLDALVAAGADVFKLAVSERPGWAPGLGPVHPHVHAKVVSVDGRAGAIGSANLDVTAGYWENELLLVVEDENVVRALDTTVDTWIAGSERIDRASPAWREAASRRAWMRRWPSLLSV